MDWNFAIERWRVPLLGHVLKLFAEIGLTEGGTVERVPKAGPPLCARHIAGGGIGRAAPDLAAAARDIVVEPPAERPARAKPKASRQGRKAEGEAKPRRKRRPLFNLFDALKRVGRRFKKKRRGPEPRIYSFVSPIRSSHRVPLRAAAPPGTCREGGVDDGMVSADESGPPPPRRGRCTAGHPPPRDAARTLAGPAQRRAPA